MNNLFLTGKIGIGKSIIINKVIKKVDCSIGGYITERQVENNIETFTAKVYKILDSEKIVFGVLKYYDCEFLNNIKIRDNVMIIDPQIKGTVPFI